MSEFTLSSQLEREWRGGAWWERAALVAYEYGYCRAISDRNTGKPYLVRFWLHPPDYKANGQGISSNSLLLHLILAPDAGTELHNHPWEFTSRVLSGWLRLIEAQSHDVAERIPVTLRRGQSYFLKTAWFHRIDDCAPSTWTLVQTGPLLNPDWQFLRDDGTLVLWSAMPGVGREE